MKAKEAEAEAVQAQLRRVQSQVAGALYATTVFRALYMLLFL
jgi:hypothetical protein